MDAPTITIGKVTATLVRPSTIAALSLLRSEDQRAGDGHEVGIAIAAAALAICWPPDVAWPILERPVPWRVGVKVELYGGQVLDKLCDGGLFALDLIAPMQAAYDWALASRIVREELQAAEGFSAAPAGG